VADPVLLDERLISGKGVLKIPSEARKLRYFRVFFDVVRPPKNPYLSQEWNPPQGLYARMVYRRDGYVQSSDSLKFKREERRFIADIAGQSLIATKCAYEGTLISFANLATGLGLTVTAVTDLIQDFQTLQLSWDEILFACYSDTALQVRLYGTDYDYCNEDPTPPNDPPPPPPPLPELPPGTPIGDISPPYDPDTNDDGNTQPYPDDSIPAPPELPGVTCQAYTLRIRIFSDGYGDPTPGYFDYEYTPYGPVFIELRDDPTPTRAYLISRSGYPLACSEEPTEELIINLGSFVITGYEVLEFTEFTPP